MVVNLVVQNAAVIFLPQVDDFAEHVEHSQLHRSYFEYLPGFFTKILLQPSQQK